MPELIKSFHEVWGRWAGYFFFKDKKAFSSHFLCHLFFNQPGCIFITRSVTYPLKRTVEYVKTVAGGDFKKTLTIKNRDELGTMVDSMNAMVGSLGDMVREIKSGIDHLNMAAADLTGLSARCPKQLSGMQKNPMRFPPLLRK